MFTYYEKDDAPEGSKSLMDESERDFGIVPNLHKVLAEAPITYEAYLQTFDAFMNDSGFSQLEAQIVFMTANYENNCHYCTAGHSWGMDAAGMPKEIIDALRQGRALEDPKFRALQVFTKELLDARGHIGDDRLKAFLAAGYTKKHALEVLCGLAAKVISNFTNALAHTELDAPMKPYAWTRPDDR